MLVDPAELLDVTVSEVLSGHPGAARVFRDRGMACLGCPFAPFETIADVAAVYGADPLELATAVLDADLPVADPGGPIQ